MTKSQAVRMSDGIGCAPSRERVIEQRRGEFLISTDRRGWIWM